MIKFDIIGKELAKIATKKIDKSFKKNKRIKENKQNSYSENQFNMGK